MTTTMNEMHRIQTVRVDDGHTLVLTWDDGTTSTVNFGLVIKQGGVFAPLADPNFFARVSLDPSGRFIFWPGDIDFCAGALRMANGTLAV